MRLRNQVWSLGFCCSAAAALCVHGSPGQPPKEKEEFGYVKVDPTKGQYYGAASCAGCHSAPPPGAPEDYDDYVLLTEHKTWSKDDKHSQAFRVLAEPRAKQMGNLLSIADVTKDNRCLNCHAMNVPEKLRFGTFKLEDGVSCDVCHGPSQEWFGRHIDPKSWRTMPMPEKEKLGFIDVRDPVKRSAMCYSCHIGNAADGRIITHDMYAAGHPPLPSIEVAMFSDQMPRHWRYSKQKDVKIQKLLQDHFKIDPTEMEQAKLVAIGGVVACRETMKLLLSQTASPEQAHAMLDFAHFDCYACHHDLKSPSWRQQRGYAGKPGRPQMRPWPFALVRVAVRHAGEDEKAFDSNVSELHNAFSAQPFGKPEAIAAAARKLAEASDQLIKKLSEKKYDRPAARGLLRELCRSADKELPDYDSARQIAWAIKIIYGELEPKPSNAQEIQGILDTLDKELKLSLPSGTGKKILDELPEGLRKIQEYDPVRVKKHLEQLLNLLP